MGLKLVLSGASTVPHTLQTRWAAKGRGSLSSRLLYKWEQLTYCRCYLRQDGGMSRRVKARQPGRQAAGAPEPAC